MEQSAETGPVHGGAGASERLESRIYARLLDRIRFGDYGLGQKLPSENDLAAEHGVSRPVIRAALARLREDGLIVSRRGAGSFVTSGAPSGGAGFRPLESIADIADYFRFRKIIETEAAAGAATRGAAGSLAGLHAILEETERQIDNGEATIETDMRFHIAIAELSDNRFLVEALGMLRPHWFFVGKFVRSLGRTGYRKGKREMSAEHRAILAAIEAGDPAAARTAMVAHIEASERRVFKGE